MKLKEKKMLGPFTNLFTINIFTAIIGLIAGVLLLWFSSEMVIKKITPIAKLFGVKELVITILGVSILSSLPELTVSAFAALQGKTDISLGNVIGSNFVTLTFVTAICAIISPILIRTEIKERESSWMTLSTVIIFILALDGKLTRIDGIILMVLYIPYIYTVVKEAVKESKITKEKVEKDKNIVLHFIIGIVAVFGIIIGADITLTSGQYIGEQAGLSNLVLGILIFAFGTSLPELSVALAATFKKKADITIGEIYASNIFTALFVLGFCCVLSPMVLFENPLIPSNLVKYDIPFLILAGIIIQIFVTTGSKLVRLEAVMIFILYVYFVLSHFINLPLSF